jgi:hypothetical protein
MDKSNLQASRQNLSNVAAMNTERHVQGGAKKRASSPMRRAGLVKSKTSTVVGPAVVAKKPRRTQRSRSAKKSASPAKKPEKKAEPKPKSKSPKKSAAKKTARSKSPKRKTK